MTARELDIDALLQTIVNRSSTCLERTAAEYLLDYPEEREVRMVFTHNLDAMRNFKFKFGEGMAGRIVEHGKPMIVNDYHTWEGRVRTLDEEPYRGLFKAVTEVPLKWQDQIIGVLSVSDGNPDRAFDEQDQHLLERFANHAALAIGNARIHSYRQKLVSSSPNAIIAVDRRGYVTEFNEASESILGFRKDDVIGQYVACYYYNGEEEARKIKLSLMDAGEEGINDYPTYVRGSTGEKIPIRLSAVLLRDEVGEEIGSLGIMTDLRDEIGLLLEQERSELLAVLEHYPQDEPILSLSDLRKRLTGQLQIAREFCQSDI